MKFIIKTLSLLTLMATSCSLPKPAAPVEKTSLAISCEDKKYDVKDADTAPKLFTCEFPEFKIFVYKTPTMANQEFIETLYSWFKQNAFYGLEIHTLQGIFFDGSETSGRTFGSYSPTYKLITIFPNNKELALEYPVPKEYAIRMGAEEIDPLLDYRYWTYTIAHEYNHHSSFFYGSKGNVVTNEFGGQEVYDLNISKKGNEFLGFTGITKNPEFNDYYKVKPIKPFSGGRPGMTPWPDKFFPTSFNKYLWTKAELFARGLALYTFPVTPELQNENSVNAFGGIIEDYWWYDYYQSNVYETNKDEDRKPVQEPVDTHLANWAEFMDNEWFNDDAKLGNVLNDFRGHIYITSKYAAKDITLVNVNNPEDIVTFSGLDKISNLKYYWRPFDSRKAKSIKLESNIFKSNKFIEDHENKYELKIKGKSTSDAFDLAQGETITLNFGQDHYIEVTKQDEKIYFDLFDIISK